MIQKKTFSAGGIVMCKENVLLVLENGNFWGFPKGRLEEGEMPLAAAKREIFEETGCADVALLRELGVYKRHPFTLQNQLDPSEVKEITMYLFEAPSKTLQTPVEPNAKGRWVAAADVAALLTHPQDREFYQRIEPTLL